MTTEAKSLLSTLIHLDGEETGGRPFATILRTGETFDYRQLAEAARKLCVLFDKSGVKTGDVVAFVASNHWFFYPLLAACAAKGAILAPTAVDLHPDELAFILSDAAPTLVISDGSFKGPMPIEKGQVVRLTDVMASVADMELPTPPLPTPVSHEVALIIYTSGSTGRPKGVMLTEANLVTTATGVARFFGLLESDRVLCVLPMHHTNAIIMSGLGPLMAGAHIFLADLFGHLNAKYYWEQVATNRITICSMVPSIMSMLLRIEPSGTQNDISVVRFIFCGTAPLSAELWQQFESTFGTPVYQGYGLTETTCWAVCTPTTRPRNYDTVGVPVESEVVIDHAADTTIAAEIVGARDGRIGEVMIRGPIVMAGYRGQPELTAKQFKGDFLKTGDLGYIDASNHLHVVGRLKEIIIKNGINILPQEIDGVVSQHEDVLESKTVGIESELVGESVVTVCVAKDPAKAPSPLAIKKFVRGRLSSYKCPDKVLVMDELPKTPTGKVAIGELRQRIKAVESALTSVASTQADESVHRLRS